MSIYATLWRLKFPSAGDDHTGCAWVGVIAQGVPAHIGSPTPDVPDEEGDPFASFLPPAVAVPPEDEDREMHDKSCDSLRGDRPRLIAESWEPDGRVRLFFADGTVQEPESRDGNGRAPA
jgi:hypothetical protein